MDNEPDSFENLSLQNDNTEENTIEDRITDTPESVTDVLENESMQMPTEENASSDETMEQTHEESTAREQEEIQQYANIPTDSQSEQEYPTEQVPPIKNGLAIIFWIILGATLLFDCLVLLVGEQHYAALAISLVILAAAFVLRKPICKNILSFVFSWLGILLLIFLIIGISMGRENVSFWQSADKAFTRQFSNGEISFTKEGFARTVDPNTYKPIEKTNVFTDNDKVINYVLLFDYIPAGVEIYAKWTHTGSGESLDFTQKIEGELKNYYYDFYLTVQPEKQLPKGDYTLEITGTKDSKVLFKVKDQFKVAQ